MPDTAGRQHADTAAITAALNEVCLDDLEISLDELLAGREEWAKHHASAQMLIVADGLAQLAAAAAAAQQRADTVMADSVEIECEQRARVAVAENERDAAVARADRLEQLARAVAHEIETDLPHRCLLCSRPGDEHVEGCVAEAFIAALAPAHVNDGADGEVQP